MTELVRRHEILRTVFVEFDARPMQVIKDEIEIHARIIDLSSLDRKQRETEALRLASSESWRPFNLAIGPLIRISVIKLGEDDYVLTLTMHHILTDGWSTGVLIDDLTTIYCAFAVGQPSPLPDLAIQYADYAVWQQAWVQSGAIDNGLAYWKKQLSNSSILDLPTDRPRPLVLGFQEGREPVVLRPQLSQKLKALSRAEGTTVFMTMLAAWQTLLLRYSGQEDISVASFIANRNRPEIEGLIGMLINYLVFRTDLSGNPSFRELLEQVRQIALEAYAHQEVPFELVLETVNPVRDPSHTPLFQVFFNLQNFPESKFTMSEVTVNPVAEEFAVEGTHGTYYDLNLVMTDGAAGLAGALDYATDLFDASTIQRMIKHFIALIEGAVENPNQRLSELPLMSESERAQLLVERNRNAQERPLDTSWFELFDGHASSQPDALAAVAGENQLTYGELNARANQVPEESAPIGGFTHTDVYVLDRYLQPVAVGIVGELLIAGPGSAVGYDNDPELTADKFIPHPFANEHGGRLYRTGTLARWLPDGGMELLGRMEDQIKIRGIRVDLRHIEKVFSKREGVLDVAVSAHEENTGDVRLVAYIASDQTEAPSSQEMQQFGKQHLPSYMVPSVFIMMNGMPTTADGKINRRALPTPPSLSMTSSQVAPGNGVEGALAEIWEQVLGKKSIGIFDNFFALGGNSILAAQATNRIRKTFRCGIPLQSIFESPTIADLAPAIEQALSANSE